MLGVKGLFGQSLYWGKEKFQVPHNLVYRNSALVTTLLLGLITLRSERERRGLFFCLIGHSQLWSLKDGGYHCFKLLKTLGPK